MNKTLSIQTHSVRDCLKGEAQTRETFKALASYGYTGIQTAGPCDWGYENFADAAKTAGLRIIGTHLQLHVHEAFDEVLRIHRALETAYAGIGGMPGLWDEDFSIKTVTDFIERANVVAEKYQQNGLGFTYHHHEREFAKYGNETVMEILMRELHPNVSFVPDTFWLQTGGVNILEYMKKMEGRMKILHLKDYAVWFGQGGGHITELGSGNINFKDVIKAAECYGVEELCYEQDDGHAIDPLQSAKQSAEYFYSIV